MAIFKTIEPTLDPLSESSRTRSGESLDSNAHLEPDEPSGRNETEFERADRNLVDLLQELRILALGVQVLFGFLLAIPFAIGFRRLDPGQRHLYVATVLLSVTAAGLLIAPVAFHRAVFHRQDKPELVAISNAVTLGGLATVGLAVSSAVWLVISVVCRGWPAVVIPVAVIVFFATIWGVIPFSRRRHA